MPFEYQNTSKQFDQFMIDGGMLAGSVAAPAVE
jgi:hypothetical protein